MPVKDLFTYPTVSLLSQYIEVTQSQGLNGLDAENSSGSIKINGAQELDLAVEVDKHDQVVME
jgi:hypothetical protein